MTYFLDTNILIYALKGGFPKIGEHMVRLSPDVIKISALVKAELFLGAKKSSQAGEAMLRVQKILSPFEVVSFDERASESYVEIRYELERKGTPIGPNDLIIAATALANQGVLVTHNVREFRRVKGLRVEDWTS